MKKEIFQGEYNGLYNPQFEHDNCGIGAVVNIKGIKSHATVANALKIVENLEHRAGKDAEGKTGDGVGILLQISHKFFSKECAKLGMDIGEERDYGIGMFFFPSDELKCKQSQKLFEVITKSEGLEFLGWRKVPVVPNVLGSKALECMPCVMQAFIKRPEHVEKGLDFDRCLYVVRRIFEQSSNNTYVVSLSSRTIVYKGMFLVAQLRTFFKDLQSPSYESAIATVHSRFSTNTQPSWERAHPNRFIVHNGEINTIKGNADKMSGREETMQSKHLEGAMNKVLPAISISGSDSAMLDNALEFMVMSGMPLPLAVMIAIPEPWDNNKGMSQNKKDFYQYYATMMEPWDGPASILFSDGDYMGAVLDRNGLRPSRYMITEDDTLILSSEVGILDIDPATIVVKERLHPGKMLLIDTVKGKLISDDELKEEYASKQPYGEWLDANLVELKDIKIPNISVPGFSKEEMVKLQKAFGYTYDAVYGSILTMASSGIESTEAMGVDSPLAVLSSKHQPMFNYFKQLFAQVTNPPIDAIREEVVTSTTVYLGKSGNILEECEENCKMLKVRNPILTNTDILKIKNMKIAGFKVKVLSTTYYKNSSLEKMMDKLFHEVDQAVEDGVNIIILSDRGVNEYSIAIPSLLALSGVQQHLVSTKKKTKVSVVLETAEPREVHHFATLLGYGATAVNPYLAHETIKDLIDTGMLNKDYYAAVNDYNYSVIHGIIKVASKMGISTIQSYLGAKIFESIGLKRDLIDKYFTGTVSRIGGIGIEEIESDYVILHSQAFDPLGLKVDLSLESIGNHKFRSGGEEHIYTPQTIHLLQQATKLGDYDMFLEYAKMVDKQGEKINLRGQMDFNYPENGISIDEVESVDEIVKRFKTGAMSYGSISKEAHETLALAMNRLKGKSNSGEGGEEIERLDTEKCSAIKQVASGRFGVTSRYLVSAKEIQIKMAQGAKPGEGGHLPGGKVYPWVAKTRNSTPGVGLISPPPHHDIYSIEDLAQLIYDCKNANTGARISVKLVSEAGVGTIAAGVAKAGAGLILISGFDGGTGAAPGSSIHNAGLPWELGLAETHQTLMFNGLRDRVCIETDGKLMSGRDVAVAAMLGAEEFGFATAPLVSMGCVMMRVCNLDTCPVGIATQNPELRKRFAGKPEYVMNFMRFVAQNLREYMAKLGVKTIEELVGRTDLLKVRDIPNSVRANTIELKNILNNPYVGSESATVFNPDKRFDFELDQVMDTKVFIDEFKPYLIKNQKHKVEVDVTNTDRTLGTIFGSEITKLYPEGVEEDSYTIKCNGAGGQSFGAFIPKGLTLELEGESNDYLGKGLSGGKIIVYPPKTVKYKKDENIIAGNVCLYGATTGKAFINGVAGERFCVRNSGALAVVEGVGDHGCEYMTGGRVAVIGQTGKNFAAGMSGGIAYVLDENNELYKNLNKEMVDIEKMISKADIKELKDMLEQHYEATKSEKALMILSDYEAYLPKFKKILPRDYAKMMKAIAYMEEKGYSHEEAQIHAFNAGKKA
ncbi:MAG: glutamate synthase large subunit [Clostridia bacterium]